MWQVTGTPRRRRSGQEGRFRPCILGEVAAALSKAKVVGVMDRSISFGLEAGPLFHELRSYMGAGGDKMSSFVYGLGGLIQFVDHCLDDVHQRFAFRRHK